MLDSTTLSKLKEGDLVFTSVENVLYQSVERATNSPTSHVGIVLKIDGEWVVAESRVPFSCYTPLADFIGRSKDGWFSIKRVDKALTDEDIITLKSACDAMMGKLYHLGFKYHSNRQFCSKFVHIAFQSIGIKVGQVMSFKELLDLNPETPRTFWRFWYFGIIPWNRLTITPGSQFDDPSLTLVC